MLIEYPGLIKFEIEKIKEDVIRSRILYQSPVVSRQPGGQARHYPLSSGWSVVSMLWSEISPRFKTVYIGGIGRTGFSTGWRTYSAAETPRDDVFDHVVAVLDEWAHSEGILELWNVAREPKQLSLWD